MMKWIYFIVLVCTFSTASAQDYNEFTETYSYVKRYQGDSIIMDWSYEVNTFVYNANGTNGVLWKNDSGVVDAFTVNGDPVVDYTEDGEEFEYRIVMSGVTDEEVMFIRFSDYAVIRLVFEDGFMMEFK